MYCRVERRCLRRITNKNNSKGSPIYWYTTVSFWLKSTNVTHRWLRRDGHCHMLAWHRHLHLPHNALQSFYTTQKYTVFIVPVNTRKFTRALALPHHSNFRIITSISDMARFSTHDRRENINPSILINWIRWIKHEMRIIILRKLAATGWRSRTSGGLRLGVASAQRKESVPAQTPRRLPNRRFYGSEINVFFRSNRPQQ